MKLEISLIAPTSVISYVNLSSLASWPHSLHQYCVYGTDPLYDEKLDLRHFMFIKISI